VAKRLEAGGGTGNDEHTSGKSRVNKTSITHPGIKTKGEHTYTIINEAAKKVPSSIGTQKKLLFPAVPQVKRAAWYCGVNPQDLIF
jgi:hypothetical protein